MQYFIVSIKERAKAHLSNTAVQFMFDEQSSESTYGDLFIDCCAREHLQLSVDNVLQVAVSATVDSRSTVNVSIDQK